MEATVDATTDADLHDMYKKLLVRAARRRGEPMMLAEQAQVE